MLEFMSVRQPKKRMTEDLSCEFMSFGTSSIAVPRFSEMRGKIQIKTRHMSTKFCWILVKPRLYDYLSNFKPLEIIRHFPIDFNLTYAMR